MRESGRVQGCRQLADDATHSGTNALKFSSLRALLFGEEVVA